jgi:hypothetical protein
MKISIIFFLLLANFSCISQNNNSNELKGNWYNLNNQNSDDVYYVETFFSDDYFQSFDESGGLMPSKKYSIEDNKIFLVPIDGSQNNSLYAIYKMEGSLLYITANNQTIVLKRIEVKSGTLEEYLNEIITEKEYWKSYMERKAEWSK